MKVLRLTSISLISFFRPSNNDMKAYLRIEHVEVLRRLAIDIENGFRGYVLTQQPAFFAPLTKAEARVESALTGTARLLAKLSGFRGRKRPTDYLRLTQPPTDREPLLPTTAINVKTLRLCPMHSMKSHRCTIYTTSLLARNVCVLMFNINALLPIQLNVNPWHMNC